MNTALIRLAGSDITDDVEVGSARFQAVVNGSIGSAAIRIKDVSHTYEPVVGQRLSLEINDSLRWSGFASEVAEEYAFVVEDTTDGRHEILTRFWAISGVDDNILFDKRFIWDPDDPAGHIDFQYLPGTFDDTIIKDVVEHYLNLAGDNITAEGVKRVRSAILDIPGVISLRSTTNHNSDGEGIVHTGTVASAGYSWKQVMDIIQRATGGIYFMDGITRSDRRILRYHDVDTINSDYALTDTPDTAVELGDPDPNDPIAGDNFSGRSVSPALNATWGLSPATGTQYYNGDDALIGVEDGVAVMIIDGTDTGVDFDWTTGYGAITQDVASDSMSLKMKFSSIPGAPPTGQGGGLRDDIGWRGWIDINFQFANYENFYLRVGTYAPPFWGPEEDGDPIEDEDNPGITLYENGGAAPDIHLVKDDWQEETWYSIKMEYDPAAGVQRIKIWESDDPEPGTWTLERDATGDATIEGPPGTLYDYGFSYVSYEWWYYDNTGTNESRIEIDDLDTGAALPVPGTPIPIENPASNPSFEDGLSDWDNSGEVRSIDRGGQYSVIGLWTGGPSLTDVTVERPFATLSVGVRLLASINVFPEFAPVTVTPAAGWTLVDEYQLGDKNLVQLYEHVVTVPGSFAQAYLFPITTSGDVYATSATTVSISPHGIVQIERAVQSAETPTGDVTTPSFVASHDGRLLAIFMANPLATQTWTTAAGLTQRLDAPQFFTSQSQQWLASGIPVSAGDTVGPYTATMSDPETPQARVGWLILFGIDPLAHDGDDEIVLDGTSDAATSEQTFVVPEGAEDLSIWYRGFCTGDSEGISIVLENISDSTTHEVLAPTCSVFSDWQEATFDLSGMVGDVVRVRLIAAEPGDGTTPPPEIDDFDDDFDRTTSPGIGGSWVWEYGDNTGETDGDVVVVPAGDYDSWTNPDIPAAAEEFDVTWDFWVPASSSNGAGNWMYYWFEYDGLSWDLWPADPGTDPPGQVVLEASLYGATTVTEPITVDESSWYRGRIHVEGGVSQYRVWKVGDVEPGTWLAEGDLDAQNRPFLVEIDGSTDEAGMVDNLHVESVTQPPDIPGGSTVAYFDDITVSGTYPAPFYPPTPLNRWNYEGAGAMPDPENVVAKGYREFRITKNGRHLTNDMHVWGAALGAKLMVHSRVEDAGSMEDHNRWEDGIFTVGLYRQVSADLVASSWVNGTPQSKRGRKNDKVTVTCRTFMSVFEVGDVVAFSNSIFGFQDALPIRSMTVSFRAAWIPIFDLVLSHEIDQPWSFYESLRKLPRPIEVGRWPWSFPIPDPRLPYCPDPLLLDDWPPGFISVFNQDFRGEAYDPDDPPRVQPDPLCGLWFGDVTFMAPRTMDEERAHGYAGSGEDVLLKSPVSGALQILGAFQAHGFSANSSFSVSTFGPNNWSRADTRFEIEKVGNNLEVTVVGYYEYDTGNPNIFDYGLAPKTVSLDARLLRQPLWIRYLDMPGYGWALKIWPRAKPEPLAWSVVFTEAEIPTGPEVIGPLHVMTDVVRLGGGNLGWEALGVYAQNMDRHTFGIRVADETAPIWSASWHYAYPVFYEPEFGNRLFYFWWNTDGAPPFISPAQNAWATDTGGLFELSTPEYVLGFAWPLFDFHWEQEHLQLGLVYQKYVAFDLRKSYEVPQGTGAVTFTRRKPDSIRITGEFRILCGNFGTQFGHTPLPFTLLTSFNIYHDEVSGGVTEPLWLDFDHAEALPAARKYISYDPTFNGGWTPFELEIAVEGFDYLQWGVSYATPIPTIQAMFQDYYAAGQPPGPPWANGDVTFYFRAMRYESKYVSDPCGTYFCVPSERLPVVGDDHLRPAWDSGDHMTYALASAFVAGSTTVYVNGLVQQYGATENYTEVPALGQIVFNVELDPDDEVAVDYEGIGPSLIP